MPAFLHLAPAGSGKTEYVLDRLFDVIQGRGKDFPKVWVLLATGRQVLDFRQRLAERSQDATAFCNVEFFSFYALNARLLNLARRPARRIQATTQLALLRQLVAGANAAGQLKHFHRIAHTRGFIEVLADLINELKQNGIDVDQFDHAASSKKDYDISVLYRRYQQTLKNNDLVDREGEGWLALATSRNRGDIVNGVDLMLVDGFDQFTPVQAQLLAELARGLQRIDITLPTLYQQSGELAHRSELTRARLEQTHTEAGASLRITTLNGGSDDRHPDLELLGRLVFRNSSADVKSDALRLVAMPTITDEAKAVLRLVKQQLLNGESGEDFMIVLRDWDRYATSFRQGQLEFGLPLLLHYQPSFQNIPVVAVLLDLLDLAPEFRRGDLLDVLHSPYLESGLDEADIDLLDRLSLEQVFDRGARDDWLNMISLARLSALDEEDERRPISSESAERLAQHLARFLDGITPPEKGDVRAYVSWIEQLIGNNPNVDWLEDPSRDLSRFSLQIAQRVTQSAQAQDALVQRDMAALNGLTAIMRDLLLSDDLIRDGFGETMSSDWRDFWAQLKHAIQSSSEPPQVAHRAGRVLVTTATEARGLPHRHIYILGLSEGIFPSEASEDPIYLDSERLRLQALDIPLSTRAERADDRGLFLELISLPRQTLTLSRPTFQEGKVWLESHFWRSVVSAFPKQPVTTAVIGQVVRPADAASLSELMLSIVDHSSGQDGRNARQMRSWLRNHPTHSKLWQRIQRGCQIEAGRLSQSPYNQFSGHLSRPELQAEVERRLSPLRIWSASQLKDYGLCGFRYFAKRLLKLDEVREPETGYDLLQLGLLNHKILEETYRQIRDRGMAIREDNQERALEIFEEVATGLLQRAPEEFGFRASASWQAEQEVLYRGLKALVRHDFSDDSPLNLLDGDRYVFDVERQFEDLRIDLPGMNEPLRMRGHIDRIDEVDGQLLVVDYKTGATRIDRSQMEAGRDFQMMAYVLALLNAPDPQGELKAGMFWHLRDLKTSGVFKIDDPDDQAAMDTALLQVAQNLRDGRRGQFPVHPNALEEGKCARYCEYAHLCRVNITNRYKHRGQDER